MSDVLRPGAIPWSIVLAVAIPALLNTVAIAIWGATLDAKTGENTRDIVSLFSITDAQDRINDMVITNTQRIADTDDRLRRVEAKVDDLYRYIPNH